jgi:hypothetical protein
VCFHREALAEVTGLISWKDAGRPSLPRFLRQGWDSTSLPCGCFLDRSELMISTVPSGNLAVIFNSPPIALTKSWSVLTYGTELATRDSGLQDSAKFFENSILRVSQSGSIFCEHCSQPGSSNSNVVNILLAKY